MHTYMHIMHAYMHTYIHAYIHTYRHRIVFRLPWGKKLVRAKMGAPVCYGCTVCLHIDSLSALQNMNMCVMCMPSSTSVYMCCFVSFFCFSCCPGKNVRTCYICCAGTCSHVCCFSVYAHMQIAHTKNVCICDLYLSNTCVHVCHRKNN